MAAQGGRSVTGHAPRKIDEISRGALFQDFCSARFRPVRVDRGGNDGGVRSRLIASLSEPNTAMCRLACDQI
jgi:hypothetical protein